MSNAVQVLPTPEETVGSWFTPPRRDAERILTRSSTQPRRSPRLDASTSKTVHFEAPRSILKKTVVRIAHKNSSPPPPSSPPLSVAVPQHTADPIVDKDAVQMPMSFPTQELGVPTLGTTLLYEPPEGELPPPSVWEDIPTSNSKHNSEQIALTHSHSLLAHALMHFTHSHSHRRVAKTL